MYLFVLSSKTGNSYSGVAGCRGATVARRHSYIAVSVHSADGNYEVTLMTKATVYYNGLVVWQPPAVYKSSCAIDVEYFPYDVQTCVLKLGSWTYDGFKVTLLYSRTSVFTPTSTPHLGQTIPYLVVFVTVTRHSSCTFSNRYHNI